MLTALRRSAPLLAVLLVAGCGGGAHTTAHGTTPPAQACPQAAGGHGSMGACAPKQKLGLTLPRAVSGPTYPDRSNNDPCYCGPTIKAQGHVGLIVKANQGTGFIDSTAVGMIASARASGLAVGEYDFDQNYTVAEAQTFVSRLHAAGIYPTTPNTFPAYLDVEYGSFSYTGLLAQIAYLRAQGYRVGIYTGAWYWGPHAGCRWPAGISAWLSGYPSAPVPCGTTGYNAHQFTSTPIDLTVYLGSGAQFQAFVNAAPPAPPKPDYSIYPQRPVLIYGHRISERGTVQSWWAHGCSNPVRRPVCRIDRQHLEWLAGRLEALARRRHDRLCINVASCGPNIWTGAPYKQPQRHYRIGRILHGKGR